MKKEIKSARVIVENINKEELLEFDMKEIMKSLTSIKELANILNVSRTTIYNLFYNETFHPVKVGSRFYVRNEEVAEYLNPIKEIKQNKDWELDKSYKKFFGIKEGGKPEPKKDKHTGKDILEDGKNKSNKAK